MAGVLKCFVNKELSLLRMQVLFYNREMPHDVMSSRTLSMSWQRYGRIDDGYYD